MKVGQRLRNTYLRNFLSLGFASLLANVLAFATSIVAMHHFSVKSYGEFNYYNSIVTYLLLIAGLGLDQYFIRVVQSKEISENQAITLQFLLRTMVTIMILTTLVICTYGFLQGVQRYLLLILGFSTISSIISITWNLQIRNKFAIISLANLFRSLTIFIFVLIETHKGSSILRMAFWYLIGNLLSPVIQWILSRHLRMIRFEGVSFRQILTALKSGFAINLSMILVSIYYNIDNIILGTFKGPTNVALYSAAYNVLLVLIVPTNILYSIYASKLSAHLFNRSILIKYVKYTTLLGILVSGVALGTYRPVMNILYGLKYHQSENMTFWLLFDLMPCYLAGAFGNPLTAWGKYKANFYIVGSAAVINLVLNLILIPQFGTSAAIGTTILAECQVAIASMFYVRKLMKTTVNSNSCPSVPIRVVK